MGKVHSLYPFPQGLYWGGGVNSQVTLKDMVTRSYDYPEQNGYLKILTRRLNEKRGTGGG